MAMTQSGMKPVTFRLVAQWPNQLHHPYRYIAFLNPTVFVTRHIYFVALVLNFAFYL